MPRALVTGATGFVGSNLVALLRQQDWQVHCLVRDAQRATHLQQQGASLFIGDLANAKSLAAAIDDVDTVFHVAGRTRALNSAQFTADNVEGTRNVVTAAAAQTQPPVTVLVSSLAAGGPSQPGKPRCENDDDHPISAYGKSKLAAEQAAEEFADRVPISIIRPPIIFGPADKATLTIFRGVKSLRLHPVPGLRKFPVSVVHVTDLCDAMIRIADRGERLPSSKNGRANNKPANKGKGRYHVAAEHTIPYSQLGKLAAQSLGCSALALPLPKILFWLVGSAAELVGQIRRRPGLLNVDKIREAVVPGWECNDEKIRNELGYQQDAPLEQRFAETCDWYREQGWL